MSLQRALNYLNGVQRRAGLSDLDKVLGYSNYLRQHSLDQGTLDMEAEIGITTATAQMLGRVDPTYKMSMDVGTTGYRCSFDRSSFW